MEHKNKTIAILKTNEEATIIGFDDDTIAMKLSSMGVLPNAKVQLVRTAPLGDTLYLKINNSQSLVLRKSEAETIQIA